MRYILSLLLLTIVFPVYADESPKASEKLLREHVYHITGLPGNRNYADTAALNKTAEYIREQFSRYSKDTYMQGFTVKGTRYYNVYCSFGPPNAPRMIIGAHYDVCGERPGADDNASGVAGLLELARLLSATDLSKSEIRIDLIAYSLEEPPYFATKDMGSSVHATALYNNRTPVVGMICLEMIGYFNDVARSQDYPLGILKLFYGNTGDFITVVRKFGGGRFCRLFTREFKRAGGVKTKVFKGPSWIKGLDFSDHRNYWKFGWPALMITDTAFYRNDNYHTKDDTPDTLDYFRMESVVTKVYKAVTGLAL